MKKTERKTVGYRCKIDEGRGGNYNGYECILEERGSGGNFSVVVLKKGKNVPLTREFGTVINKYAWVNEKNLKIVDRNISDNVEFIDWYSEMEDFACPDCGYFEPDQTDFIEKCPKCGFED